MKDERLLALADLAEGQWGLFTSAQAALEPGVNALQLKRYTDRGVLTRVRHGVYRLSGSPPSPLEAIRAEWLALDPQRTAGERLRDPVPIGVISHRSAAVLQDLGDLDADIHQFTVPRRRHTRSPDVAFRVADLEHGDWHRIGGLPVTRPLRTVVDLAEAHTDGGHLAGIVRDAILTGGAASAALAETLRPYAHYYGLRAGDGTGLVKEFIQTAGIPANAIDLAGPAITAAIIASATAILQNIDLAALLRNLDIAGLLPGADLTALVPGEISGALNAVTSSPELIEALIAINSAALPPAVAAIASTPTSTAANADAVR